MLNFRSSGVSISLLISFGGRWCAVTSNPSSNRLGSCGFTSGDGVTIAVVDVVVIVVDGGTVVPIFDSVTIGGFGLIVTVVDGVGDVLGADRGSGVASESVVVVPVAALEVTDIDDGGTVAAAAGDPCCSRFEAASAPPPPLLLLMEA
uniref:Putative secreted protein n=1 Tax=Anopheles darlingi TaxID=43151 RepID=A0A2M4D718_ANODA